MKHLKENPITYTRHKLYQHPNRRPMNDITTTLKPMNVPRKLSKTNPELVPKHKAFDTNIGGPIDTPPLTKYPTTKTNFENENKFLTKMKETTNPNP